MRYFIITFGCQTNKSDSERIVTVLENRGYQPASKIDEADLVVVNMCSVRQSAVDRVYGLAQKLKNLKSEKPELKTILTGCILKSDRKKFKNHFDLILNIKDLPNLPSIIRKEHYTLSSHGRITCNNRNYLKIKPRYSNNFSAFVPISNGCNNFCTYCVVPFTRGSLVCRDHRGILKEVKKAVQNGAKEIWLLGQNVNDYTSSTDSSIDFSELLRMINDIPDDFLIRFVSPNPKNFSDKLVETMAEAKKIAKYLHLPVQSGDNEILKKMNRPYTVKQYKNLVKKIRKKIPEINLSTDVIVGFPGETKKQFQNTVKLFKEIKFNLAYIAKYSPRPGTAAFKLKDNVSLKEKKRRWKILNNILLQAKK